MCSHIPRWHFKSGYKKRKHRVHAYFRKKTQKRSILRAEKYGDLITAPQRRTCIPEQSPIRCRATSSRHSVESVSNLNFTGDGEQFTKVYRNRRRSQNLFIRTIYDNLASIVKNYQGIIEQLHFIDQRQAELQMELYVEQMKWHQPWYCNLDRMLSDGWIPRNAVTICEMTKTSWQTGNLKRNKHVDNPSRTCFVRGENFGKKILWLLRLKNWKS